MINVSHCQRTRGADTFITRMIPSEWQIEQLLVLHNSPTLLGAPGRRPRKKLPLPPRKLPPFWPPESWSRDQAMQRAYWTNWNNSHEVGNSAYSLLKWRYLCRRLPGGVRFLMVSDGRHLKYNFKHFTNLNGSLTLYNMQHTIYNYTT